MIWHPCFSRVKVNHRRVYSRILVKVCAVSMTTGLLKNKAEGNFLEIVLLSNIFLNLPFYRESKAVSIRTSSIASFKPFLIVWL